jgi:hypothetical protein
LIVVMLCSACGKKGPPLPPLVRMPVAPADLVAERRGDTVDLQFTVPSTNTDGTRPANVSTAEVYAITAPASIAPPAYTEAQILKYGTKVATVDVKAPRDPNLTADPDEPADEVDAPEGAGLDQGTLARVAEPLTSELLKPVAVPPDAQAPAGAAAPETDHTSGPLLGPTSAAPSRTYAAVGVSTRGKKGPLSRRAIVPLVPPPPAPAPPAIAYDEKAITVTWPPIGAAPPHAPATGDAAVLPSRIIGVTRPDITYNVYDASNPDAIVKLTPAPIAEPTYTDSRIAWGVKRCYTVRAAERVAGAIIEGDAAPARCKTLADTFAPEAPKGLTAIPSDGAINLIWEPNAEKDLAGYIVLRGTAAAGTLEPITAPIQETSFKDGVQPGVSYVYAVTAVDRAGNTSPPSARVTETAR